MGRLGGAITRMLQAGSRSAWPGLRPCSTPASSTRPGSCWACSGSCADAVLVLRALGGLARVDALGPVVFVGCSSESRRLSIASTRPSSGSIARSLVATCWSCSPTRSIVPTTMRRGTATSRRKASSPASASREMASLSWVLLVPAIAENDSAFSRERLGNLRRRTWRRGDGATTWSGVEGRFAVD